MAGVKEAPGTLEQISLTSCECCGQLVQVVSTDEGTNSYAPQEREQARATLLAELRREVEERIDHYQREWEDDVVAGLRQALAIIDRLARDE